MKLTPDGLFIRSNLLSRFVNQNEASILLERHEVPEVFEGQAFLGGSSFNDLQPWFGDGTIANNEARHKLSLNTCNGCHGPEAGVTFLQISPRLGPGNEARLSGFLTGTLAPDRVTGEVREFNDLRRRRGDLETLVCAAPSSARGAVPSPGASTIAEGIRRVH